MTQFSMAVLALQPDSKFAQAYQDGTHMNQALTAAVPLCTLCCAATNAGSLQYLHLYGIWYTVKLFEDQQAMLVTSDSAFRSPSAAAAQAPS